MTKWWVSAWFDGQLVVATAAVRFGDECWLHVVMGFADHNACPDRPLSIFFLVVVLMGCGKMKRVLCSSTPHKHKPRGTQRVSRLKVTVMGDGTSCCHVTETQSDMRIAC
jgi:hypothetical protein